MSKQVRVYVDVERTAYGMADDGIPWDEAERYAEEFDRLISDQRFYITDGGKYVEMKVMRED